MIPFFSSLWTMEMWLRAMMASMLWWFWAERHFFSVALTLQATSCSARLLWLEISMMMTSSPFRTDKPQLLKMNVNSVNSVNHATSKTEFQTSYPVVPSMRSMAEGMAHRRPLEPSGVAEPMLAKISSIIWVPDSERGRHAPTLRGSCLLAPVMTFRVWERKMYIHHHSEVTILLYP